MARPRPHRLYLHSADPETMDLIDGLVDGLPGARIMILVSFRPEFDDVWTGRSYFTQIPVSLVVEIVLPLTRA